MPAPEWRTVGPTALTMRLTLTTITPMFGGGATTRTVGDPPIRAASIRGHLRFWWRATAGASYTDAADLYEKETRIWGNTDSPSDVTIRVDIIKAGAVAPLRAYLPKPAPSRGPGVGYFVFPFDSDSNNPVPIDGRKDVEFRLTVRMPIGFEYEADVRRAIQAWLIFGGVGARTRRGCGALKCAEPGWLPKVPTDVANFVAIPAKGMHGLSGPPSLASVRILFRDPPTSGEDAWGRLARLWARFRKGHYTNRRPKYEPRSGAQWSDHTTLKESQESHADHIALAKPYLGLPIIYHDFSKDDPKFRGKFHGTLEPARSRRMASPVVLKPVAFGDGKIRPMVAYLRTEPPGEIKVAGRSVRLHVPTEDSVLRDLGATGIVDAVVKAARQEGFTEVRL
jgi:CRISPR-associated protein Cmr1